MAFWVYMLVCDLLVPGLMIVSGWWMWKYPPENINRIMGYRTTFSMKNRDTWEFAQAHCGRIWWKTGLALLLPVVVILLFFLNTDKELLSIIGLSVLFGEIGIMLLAALSTEIALRQAFDQKGSRKV